MKDLEKVSPSIIRIEEIDRRESLGEAIELCVDLGGYQFKKLQAELGVDKAQFSRWLGGSEGIVWPKLERLMNKCRNDVPVLWMVHQRGWDLSSMKRVESELERRCRELEEKVKQLELEREIEARFLTRVRAA